MLTKFVGRLNSVKSAQLIGIRLFSIPRSQALQQSASSSSASKSPSSNRTQLKKPTTTRQVTIDRELPDPFAFKKQNYYYFTCYGLGVFFACVFIFNYEKTTSPVINSVMYFLRRSNYALSALGDDITFAYQWPWIWGTLNTVRGDVDIQFDVKGSKASGVLYLVANRESKQEQFKVRKWLLKINDERNTNIDLMKDPSIQLGL
ncbi:cytochrome c oxidase assembly factor 1 [[Candida] railenensis]|uniref:Cytochrome c oxidase assembly factor 1 n=1 Tax=[Candida] railenensis TaxID=45579 RepID=A0A9P0VZZ7_9ASCO|nr:cytochrome c oxidase assembly factor 1 [[Candida] railenensis]